MKKISIVIPVYNESDTLHDFSIRLKAVIDNLTNYQWECIFVNDGSSDQSLSILRTLSMPCDNFKVLDFSRNFGKENALTAGVHEASSSDAVICIDADLQHPPELIPKLINAWVDDIDIVATVRTGIDKQPILRRIGSKSFYWLMSKISGTKMESQTTDYRLYDKKVIHAFSSMTERERMFRGIMDWMGFNKVFIDFKADARMGGDPGYSYSKLWELAINSITSFSLWPLKITGYLGVFITSLSGILLIWMLINYFFISFWVYTPIAIVVVANTFLMGLVLVSIGLVAIYVGKIHTEAINRPLYIVRERISSDESAQKLNKTF